MGKSHGRLNYKEASLAEESKIGGNTLILFGLRVPGKINKQSLKSSHTLLKACSYLNFKMKGKKIKHLNNIKH